MRRKFEGAMNVLRFNWPKYLLGIAVCSVASVGALITTGGTEVLLAIVAVLSGVALVVPFLVTYFVYDRSSLHDLPWLDTLDLGPDAIVLNINAGFDETTPRLRHRFPRSTVHACDFYDPALHTEPSIRRARRAYPPHSGTSAITTTRLPFPEGSVRLVHCFLSLHEVRDAQERVRFLRVLHDTLAPEGRLIIVEHLRDPANLFAFNIGAFHFHTRATWESAFEESGLDTEARSRTTPFITTYILRRG